LQAPIAEGTTIPIRGLLIGAWHKQPRRQ
jgi:hypothetical protein